MHRMVLQKTIGSVTKKIIVDDVTDMWFYVCIALIVPKSYGDKEEPGLEGWMPCVWWVDVTAEVLHA